MSVKSKGNTVRNGWQKTFIKWNIGKGFDHAGLYGYHTYPQYGPSTQMGELVVYGQCGVQVMDPATIQGTRIIRNMKLKVIQVENSINKDLAVFVYKYNEAYGGRPCCDYEPTPSEAQQNLSKVSYSISNYQNMLGQSVFNNRDPTEHEINIEGEYHLESGDVICISLGNLEMFGSVAQSGDDWVKVSEEVTGSIGVAGTFECEIAFI